MKNDKFFHVVEPNLWDPSFRMDECNNYDMDFKLLSTVPVMFSYWSKADDALNLSKLLNDHIAAVVAEYHKQFSGLGTIPLQDTEKAVSE